MSMNVFSMESLVSWLETKDPNGQYNYCDPYGCLLHQYFTEKGVKTSLFADPDRVHLYITSAYIEFYVPGRGVVERMGLPHGFDRVARTGATEAPDRDFGERYNTYGRALETAKKELERGA